MTDDGDALTLDLSHLTPVQRETMRRLATDAGLPILNAIAEIDAAMTAGRANTTEARAAAQHAALDARDRLLDATGVTALEKRRLYATAHGMAEGSPCEAADFDAMLASKDYRTPPYRMRLRMAFARFALDNARLFGVRDTGLLAGTAMEHNRGREGALDCDLPPDVAAAIDDAMLGVSTRERISGVTAKGADIDALLMRVGLEMGRDSRRLYGARGRVDPEFWELWARHFNKTCAEFKIPARRGGGFYNLSPEKLRTMTYQHPVVSMAYEAGRKEENPPAVTTVPT